MTFKREAITNEDGSRIYWDANMATMCSVVNKDAVNKYGEYRSYKICSSTLSTSSSSSFHSFPLNLLPGSGQRNYLIIPNSIAFSSTAH